MPHDLLEFALPPAFDLTPDRLAPIPSQLKACHITVLIRDAGDTDPCPQRRCDMLPRLVYFGGIGQQTPA
jgi:hypothetical protein